MRISLVVAVAENGIIGADGKLPWRLKGDMRFFRQITMGKPIVMGRKTFETLPGILGGRDNIVISQQRDFSVPGAFVVGGVEDAAVLAHEKALERGVDEFCVIGGAQIYGEFMARAKRIYMTRVHARPEGDAVFPELDKGEWGEVSRQFFPKDENNSTDYSIIVLQRA